MDRPAAHNNPSVAPPRTSLGQRATVSRGRDRAAPLPTHLLRICAGALKCPEQWGIPKLANGQRHTVALPRKHLLALREGAKGKNGRLAPTRRQGKEAASFAKQKKFVNIRKRPEACASGHFLYDKGENYELCFASPMSSSTLCLYYRTFSQKVKLIPRKISKNYFFVFCNISRKFYAQTCTFFCKILTNCPIRPLLATKFGKRGSPGLLPESFPQAPQGRAGAILSSRPQNRGRKDRSRSRSSRTPRRRSAQDSCPRRMLR